MTEPQFIRERCLKLIREPSMHVVKWSMTILDAVHSPIRDVVTLAEDEYPIASFYSQEDQWTLYTTHRLLGSHGDRHFEVERDQFTNVQFGDPKQGLGPPVVISATMPLKWKSVSFLYESGYASMAPIYYFRFWMLKWPVWQHTWRLQRQNQFPPSDSPEK